MRMKFIRILPETRARTRWPLASSTRKKALGNGSTTVPSTSMASSLVDPIFSTRSAFFFFLSERLKPPRLCGATLVSPHGLPTKALERLAQRLFFIQCEHVVAVRGHRNGVFEVRRKSAVGGHHRPAVGFGSDFPGTGIDHRLDRDDHARLEYRTRARATIVGHRRVFVQARADTVTDQGAHDRESLGLDVLLHRRAHIGDVSAWTHLVDAAYQRFSSDVDEVLRFLRHAAHRNRASHVRIPAVDARADVYLEQIALLQLASAGDAMHDLVVDRRAHRSAKAVIA